MVTLVNKDNPEDTLTCEPAQGPTSGYTMTFNIDTTGATPGATYIPSAFNGTAAPTPETPT